MKYPFLDLLRGLSVILVLIRHAPWADGTYLEAYGWLGVDIFFGISGFLISGLLFKEIRDFGEIRVIRFYKRRALKILPSFFVLLLITPLINWEGFNAYFAEFAFLQSYLPHVWGHTWSISVEEHFYLMLPLVLGGYFYKNDVSLYSFKKLFIFVFIFCIIVLISRIINLEFINPNITRQTHTNPTHLRVDSLLYGILAQVFLQMGVKRNALLKVLMTVVFVLYFYINFYSPWSSFGNNLDKSPFNITFGYSVFGLFVMFLLINFYDYKLSSSNIFSRVGAFSYNIYLFHLPVLLFFKRLNYSGFILFPTYILCSILIGFLMTIIIERPFLQLRAKLCP